MIYKDNPCYKCEDRVVGCHSTCEKYKAWQKSCDEEKAKYYEQKNRDRQHLLYVKDSRTKAMRKQRRG